MKLLSILCFLFSFPVFASEYSCPKGTFKIGGIPPENHQLNCAIKGKKKGEEIFNGPTWVFHPNGKLRQLITFKSDLKHGPTEEWNKDGNLNYKGNFRSDLRAGKWTFFHNDKSKKGELSFNKKGDISKIKVWDINSKQIHIKDSVISTYLKSSECYDGAQVFGFPRPFFNAMSCQKPFNGAYKRHGKFISWHENGVVNFISDNLYGIMLSMTSWDQTGKLTNSAFFTDADSLKCPRGTQIRNFEAGIVEKGLAETGCIKLGNEMSPPKKDYAELSGIWLSFGKKGLSGVSKNIKRLAFYEKNRLVKVKVFNEEGKVVEEAITVGEKVYNYSWNALLDNSKKERHLVGSLPKWYLVDLKNDTGFIVRSKKSPRKIISYKLFGKKDFDLYNRLQDEMMLPKYSDLSDEDMMVEISKKLGTPVKNLNELNINIGATNLMEASGKLRETNKNVRKINKSVAEFVAQTSGYEKAEADTSFQFAGKHKGNVLVTIKVHLKKNGNSSTDIKNAKSDMRRIRDRLIQYHNVGEVMFQFLDTSSNDPSGIAYKGVLDKKSVKPYNQYFGKGYRGIANQ